MARLVSHHGEQVDRLEEFRPEGLASRILGMGDIVGLVKDFEEVVDEEQAEQDADRILKGQFTLDDLLTQLRTLQKMGPLREVFAKMPMFGEMADQVDERELGKVESMVHSMTQSERVNPDSIDKSRASRIARGSGRQPKDVLDLVKRFDQMRTVMSQLGSGGDGMLSRIPGMGRLAGGGGLDPAALLGGAAPTGTARTPSRDSTARKKRKRQQARKSRRKGRKR